jgi:hypothetical protein
VKTEKNICEYATFVKGKKIRKHTHMPIILQKKNPRRIIILITIKTNENDSPQVMEMRG